MRALLEAITSKDFSQAGILAEELVSFIMEKKLLEMKKMVGSVMVSEMNLNGIKPDYENIEDRRKDQVAMSHLKKDRQDAQISNDREKGNLPTQKIRNNEPKDENVGMEESNEQLDEAARFKIVKARIRGGKVQRRRKVATVKGLTFRGGRLIRMSPAERRRRKLGQRRGKIKRKSKINRTLMKRKRSMLRRKAMGIR